MIVVLIVALAAAVTAAAILGRMYQREKRTVIVLNRQLDLSHKAFMKQRRKLREQTTENELLKADIELMEEREQRIKETVAAYERKRIPWEAD